MTHELVHMAFPSVPRQHHWVEEGLATYVEPIARAQAASLGAERVWADMLHAMPQGHGRGIDHTRNWRRTYWAARYSVCLAMCSSGSGRESTVACSTRYGVFRSEPKILLPRFGQKRPRDILQAASG
jgi:hypothetical protein